MSTENTSASRAFEVHGTLNMGFRQTDKKAPRELDIRKPGGNSTVTEEELKSVGMSADDIESLLANGTISDPDAPTRPSLAPLYAAHNFGVRLLKHFGLLKTRGADHIFEGQTFGGAQAFRDSVSIERIENALRSAWEGR
jgi:hypothetical protein